MMALIIAATSVGSAWIALLLVSLRYVMNRAPRIAWRRLANLRWNRLCSCSTTSIWSMPRNRRARCSMPRRSAKASGRGFRPFSHRGLKVLRRRLAGLAEQGRIELESRPARHWRSALRLIAEDRGGLARLTLIDPDAEGRGVLVDGLSQRALEDEVEQLRSRDRPGRRCSPGAKSLGAQ